MPNNTYYEQLNRTAAALERIADGAGKPLVGKTYDLKTDDGVRTALVAVVHALGGEVSNA